MHPSRQTTASDDVTPLSALAGKKTHAVTDVVSRQTKAAKIAELLSRRCDIRGAKVLDIGTGSGWIANYFTELVGPEGEVVAVDAVNQLQDDSHVEFRLAKGSTIPCEDGQFDIVISNHVVEHVGDAAEQRQHVQEIDRVMVAEGVLYLAVPNRWGLLEPHYKLPLLSWLPNRIADLYVRLTGRGLGYDCRLLSRGEVIRIASQNFRVEDVTLEALRLFIAAEMKGFLAMTARLICDRFFRFCRPFVPTLVFICRPRA